MTNRYQSLIAIVFVLMAILLVACGNNDEVPPTEVRVITNTPGSQPVGNPDTVQQTIDAMAESQANAQGTIAALNAQIATQNAPVGEGTSESGSLATNVPGAVGETTNGATPTVTDLPSIFPTPRIEQAIVVEQVFENGRMFWFRDWRTVWVVVGDEVDPTSGEWLCFQDTFVEGDVEMEETFEPPTDATTESEFPDADLQQPIRGFGKIWRENDELREQLGWALTNEIEHNSRRTYLAGGYVDTDNQYVPAPGEWRLNSHYGETFTFLEEEQGTACPSGRWRSRSSN